MGWGGDEGLFLGSGVPPSRQWGMGGAESCPCMRFSEVYIGDVRFLLFSLSTHALVFDCRLDIQQIELLKELNNGCL